MPLGITQVKEGTSGAFGMIRGIMPILIEVLRHREHYHYTYNPLTSFYAINRPQGQRTHQVSYFESVLSGIFSHSFRKTQLSELCRDGLSLREIQHISGHCSHQSLQQ